MTKLRSCYVANGSASRSNYGISYAGRAKYPVMNCREIISGTPDWFTMLCSLYFIDMFSVIAYEHGCELPRFNRHTHSIRGGAAMQHL